MSAALGILIIVAIAAFVVVGFLAVTASWSRTVAHGAAVRVSVREVRRAARSAGKRK